MPPEPSHPTINTHTQTHTENVCVCVYAHLTVWVCGPVLHRPRMTNGSWLSDWSQSSSASRQRRSSLPVFNTWCQLPLPKAFQAHIRDPIWTLARPHPNKLQNSYKTGKLGEKKQDCRIILLLNHENIIFRFCTVFIGPRDFSDESTFKTWGLKVICEFGNSSWENNPQKQGRNLWQLSFCSVWKGTRTILNGPGCRIVFSILEWIKKSYFDQIMTEINHICHTLRSGSTRSSFRAWTRLSH